MPHIVRCSRIAMACRCEVIVVHDDFAVATQAANAALDEISRVESLLSRFDPAGEISRINREAGYGPVTLDYEVFALLSRCHKAYELTNGAFDIAAGSPVTSVAFRLIASSRSIVFDDPRLQLDLGGCGKGYALDCAAAVLRSAGITRACLHAGTSSVLAMRAQPDAAGWPIAIVDPMDRSRERDRVLLSDQALSTSAVAEAADILDPHSGRPVIGPRSCTVVAATAFEAEVWSTAGIVAGETRADSGR